MSVDLSNNKLEVLYDSRKESDDNESYTIIYDIVGEDKILKYNNEPELIEIEYNACKTCSSVSPYFENSKLAKFGDKIGIVFDKLEHADANELSKNWIKYFKQLIHQTLKIEQAGMYHNDIKNSNIMLDKKTDTLYLIDLGLASNIDEEIEHQICSTDYRPPEACDFDDEEAAKFLEDRHGKDVLATCKDYCKRIYFKNSDVYALGTTFYRPGYRFMSTQFSRIVNNMVHPNHEHRYSIQEVWDLVKDIPDEFDEECLRRLEEFNDLYSSRMKDCDDDDVDMDEYSEEETGVQTLMETAFLEIRKHVQMDDDKANFVLQKTVERLKEDGYI